MKFLVLQGHDGALDFADLSQRSYMEYANRHGYDYHCAVFDTNRKMHGHASWQKLPLLQRVIEEGRYAWFLWADIDSIVTNTQLRLFDRTMPEGWVKDEWLIVSQDWSDGSPWSAGVMLIRSCREAHGFFSVAKTHKQFMNSGCWDQSAMQAVLDEHEHPRTGVKILPRRILQSVPKECSRGVLEPWQLGDYICHATGIEDKHKREILMRYEKRVI